jgi:hypothetical protein
MSLDGVAEAPEEFFTEWNDTLDAHLDLDRAPHTFEVRSRPRAT